MAHPAYVLIIKTKSVDTCNARKMFSFFEQLFSLNFWLFLKKNMEGFFFSVLKLIVTCIQIRPYFSASGLNRTKETKNMIKKKALPNQENIIWEHGSFFAIDFFSNGTFWHKILCPLATFKIRAGTKSLHFALVKSYSWKKPVLCPFLF